MGQAFPAHVAWRRQLGLRGPCGRRAGAWAAEQAPSRLPSALGTAALVRSPGQAEAEEPGSVEKSQLGGQSPEAGDQPWAQLLQSQAGEGWLWTWG